MRRIVERIGTLLARVHVPALASVVIAGALVAVGAARMLAYPGSQLEAALEGSPLAPLTHRSEDLWNTQYFKALATLSTVSLMYFAFRVLNRLHGHVLDFRSPGLRLALVAVASLHWVVLELARSPAEVAGAPTTAGRWAVHVIVLVVGSVVAWFGMKHLSFEPILRRPRDGS